VGRHAIGTLRLGPACCSARCGREVSAGLSTHLALHRTLPWLRATVRSVLSLAVHLSRLLGSDQKMSAASYSMSVAILTSQPWVYLQIA
jgi:hypothetical protein